MSGGLDHSNCSLCCCTSANTVLTVTFMVLLTVAVLFGNSVTLVVFLGTKQFRSPHGYLKASLAVADLAVGVVVVPFSVYSEVYLMLKGSPTEWAPGTSPSGDYLQPCTVIGTVFAGCTLVSISTIFLLTVERSVAILKPLHKGAVITRRRTVCLIGISWLASFFLALCPLTFSREIVLEYNKCSRMCNFALLGGAFPQSGWKILLLFPAFDFTLLGGTVLINLLSLSSIRQYSKQREILAKRGGGSRPSFSDIKAAKTIGTLTLAFTASFTPVAVYVVGNVLGYQWCEFSFIAFWILTSNSCWNVIIYSVRDQKFRQRALELFTGSKSAIATDR